MFVFFYVAKTYFKSWEDESRRKDGKVRKEEQKQQPKLEKHIQEDVNKTNTHPAEHLMPKIKLWHVAGNI